ncbi:DMT family transporter [Hahella aquimaris]|uniref:DMT family transporter n=1 Tax=Hahella sp. HNIBRBA332 TaxID=3015983 RepID=UPI00273AFA41|nr:DMT family transporter [Hahella sp. HNIBRBA332]WLQ12663.1 DMT family transporter [Hahella sp. HNIBRBA332]
MVILAYAMVILVWSTTPLGVVWSSQSFHPTVAVGLRMTIAAIVTGVVIRLYRIPLHWDRDSLYSYLCGTMGVFGAMMLTYFASKTVPSGLISVMYGLSPIMSGLLGVYLLDGVRFQKRQWLALGLAISGLATVFGKDLHASGAIAFGLLLVLGAVALFSLSGVLLKKQKATPHPLALTFGSILLALPGYFILWALMDGKIPQITLNDRGLWAVVYLALVGSVLGFFAYYYVLQKLQPSTVAMATLVTPVLALLLGVTLNDETIHPTVLLGGCLILLGLALYFDLPRKALRWLRPISAPVLVVPLSEEENKRTDQQSAGEV